MSEQINGDVLSQPLQPMMIVPPMSGPVYLVKISHEPAFAVQVTEVGFYDPHGNWQVASHFEGYEDAAHYANTLNAAMPNSLAVGLRDHFAGMALTAAAATLMDELPDAMPVEDILNSVARCAYIVSDAMLRARAVDQSSYGEDYATWRTEQFYRNEQARIDAGEISETGFALDKEVSD